jgi:hypothetical protein
MKTKAKDQIKKTIDGIADSQINIASDSAREYLAEKIHADLAERFHIFKINELIVEGRKNPNGVPTPEPPLEYVPRRSDEWRIEQYNRNREAKDHISTIEEMEKRVAKGFKMPDGYGVDQGGAYRIVDDAGVDVKTGKFTG